MRAQAFLLVFSLASLVAGCASPANPPTTPTLTTPEVGAGAFTTPVVVTKGTAEPGLLLDNESNVWVHAPGGLWKSADNGATFTAIDFGPGPVFGGDAELTIARNGSLYYSDLEQLAALSVFSSHDKGKTWSYQPIASDAPLTDRQWMANGKDVGPLAGAPDAVYLAYNQLASGVWVTKSTDGGLKWTPHLAFATSGATEVDFQTMGNIVVDPKGIVYVSFTMGSAGAPLTPPLNGYAVVVLVSEDGGLTWTPRTVAKGAESYSNLFPILAVDDAGTLYATFAAKLEGGTTDVWLTYSKDHGAKWSKPVKVDSHVGSHAQPWVSTGDVPGELALAWYENPLPGRPQDVKGEWHVQASYTKNGDTDAPTFREMQVSPGTVHKGPICVDGVLCQGGRELLDFFQIRLDARNVAHVAYADNAEGGAKVIYTRSTSPMG
ncbi:MAG: sialidase family protein [Candidatus Thermoplasmatota archaeon]